MAKIRIAPRNFVAYDSIAQVVELKDMADKTVLIKACRKNNLNISIGRPNRTAVFFEDGNVFLTPFSAQIIFERIQMAEFLRIDWTCHLVQCYNPNSKLYS